MVNLNLLEFTEIFSLFGVLLYLVKLEIHNTTFTIHHVVEVFSHFNLSWYTGSF